MVANRRVLIFLPDSYAVSIINLTTKAAQPHAVTNALTSVTNVHFFAFVKHPTGNPRMDPAKFNHSHPQGLPTGICVLPPTMFALYLVLVLSTNWCVYTYMYIYIDICVYIYICILICVYIYTQRLSCKT